MKRALVLLLAAACAAMPAGCAKPPAYPAGPAGPPPVPKQTNLIPDGYTGRFQLQATVLQNAEHGPQLCATVAESLPPQCSGPDIANWKWEGLDSDEAQGTRWGAYIVTGTWDGKLFTLTEPAKDDDGSLSQTHPAPNFGTPCPPPAGGWKPVNEARATDDALNAATTLVAGDPDFSGLWVDEALDPSQATPMNNPRRLVLNVRFVRDLERHEAELRKVWGGALCVSKGERTEADLQRIQQELAEEPHLNYAATDVITSTVEIGVFAAYAGRQRELDARYGEGVVVLRGTLKPID